MSSVKTKAETLAHLRGRVTHCVILDGVYFSIKAWRNEANMQLGNIQTQFSRDCLFIVRSSSLSEDAEKESNAGKFLSLKNISFEELPNAIEQVIQSYGKAQEGDQILVQPMLNNVIMAGVLFTKDPSTG